MAEQNFSRPAFLGPETILREAHTNLITGEKIYHGGGFVVMADLERTPPDIRQKTPDGYVIKQYRFKEYSPIWNELFPADEDLDTNTDDNNGRRRILFFAEDALARFGRKPTPKELFSLIPGEDKKTFHIDERLVAETLKRYSLKAKARKLKEHYDRIRAEFKDELPEIIVPTQFIVGAERNAKHPVRDGERRLYELQPKINAPEKLPHDETIHDYVLCGGDAGKNYLYDNPREPIPNDIAEIAKSWAEWIKSKFPEKWQQIKEGLKKFIALARGIPAKMKVIPIDMVHPYNIRFTADGIRIIDINQVLPNLDKDSKWREMVQPERNLARYNRFLDVWQIVCDKLCTLDILPPIWYNIVNKKWP